MNAEDPPRDREDTDRDAIPPPPSPRIRPDPTLDELTLRGLTRLRALAVTFPSLAARLSADPLATVAELKAIASGPREGGPASREAARFCLLVWDGSIARRAPVEYTWHPREMPRWDAAHLAAWQAWAAAPWWA